MKEIQDATVREICKNAGVVAVLSELVSKKMTVKVKVFLSEKDDFTSLSTDIGVKSLRRRALIKLTP